MNEKKGKKPTLHYDAMVKYSLLGKLGTKTLSLLGHRLKQ
jgi:hypothetical protein